MQRSAKRLCRDLEQHVAPLTEKQHRALHYLLRRKSVIRALGANNGFFMALLHCLESGEPWRELSNWHIPRSCDPVRIFQSLVNHVYVRYPLPMPLYKALVQAVAVENDARHPTVAWFFHVARGENLSRVDGLPFEFTKKAAHLFSQAPEHLSIFAAMRWAQVMAMGGSDRHAIEFARALSRPYDGFEQEWSAVIRFVVRYQEEIAPVTISEIVQFVTCQRLEKREVSISGISEIVEPLYPSFDIREATVQSLQQRMATWDKHTLAVMLAIQNKPFPPNRLQDVYQIPTPYGLVRIERLKTIAALIIEGTQMRHCVGTYGDLCQSGQSSIWSIMLDQGKRQLATLELNRHFHIVQIQGKANSNAPDEAMQAVEKWARAEGLSR